DFFCGFAKDISAKRRVGGSYRLQLSNDCFSVLGPLCPIESVEYIEALRHTINEPQVWRLPTPSLDVVLLWRLMVVVLEAVVECVLPGNTTAMVIGRRGKPVLGCVLRDPVEKALGNEQSIELSRGSQHDVPPVVVGRRGPYMEP